ncbi:MAG: diadenylate cyclase CdaA [Chloroflexota bacterium]|nr:diadenylate cyclase CdaA [Chloroflexota bacterium]
MDLAPLLDRVVVLVQGTWSSVAGRFGVNTILDIAIVAVVLYWLLSLIAGTSAATLVRGILILLTLGFGLSNLFNLTMLQYLLRSSIPALIFAIPVLFQPELRRALEQLGRAGSLIPRNTVSSPNNRPAETIARAAQQLAERRFGALLVIERSTPLGEYASKGVPIDAVLSTELLLNIFWPNSPLHDGAVIVHGERVVAAGVVLPLAQAPSAEHIGTRHRAAIGITEISDAIAVVVSEETGQIALANAGRMVRNLGQARLQKVLSILDRSSTANGTHGRRAPGIQRARQPREKQRETPPKRDDSESDAA